MENIKALDNQLYRARYGIPRKGDPIKIWDSIKNNHELLREAVKIIRNKFNDGYTLKGTAIADAILIDYKNVDEVAYNNLISAIYNYPDIARTVLDRGYSFLLMSLWNKSVKLTEKQKKFVQNEAMHMPGTVLELKRDKEFEKELTKRGVTDEDIVALQFSGSSQPIGAKSGCIYFANLLRMLEKEKVHGCGDFDIRYYILKNSNWTVSEKQKLIFDFWYDQEEYEETLNQWEWAIINDSPENVQDNIDKVDLLNFYTYEMLLKLYPNEETAKLFWEEIELCKQMHSLRPTEEDKEYTYKK